MTGHPLGGRADLLEDVACDSCGSERRRLRHAATVQAAPDGSLAYRCTHDGYGHHHAVVECLDCDLLYCSPRPTAAAVLGAYQEVEDARYLEEEAGRRATFARRLSRLERFVRPPGRLLDVGAYTGAFVAQANAAGWQACGVEPSRWAVGVARARNLEMYPGTLEQADLAPGSFDVVTLWDMIEHVHSPAATLARVAELLRPGGLAVVHTMDVESPVARLLGRRWPWLMEMHLFYFSRRSLGRQLQASGLELLRIAAEGRVVPLGYLLERGLTIFGPKLGRLGARLALALGVAGWLVPVNFGDLVSAYARRPPAPGPPR